VESFFRLNFQANELPWPVAKVSLFGRREPEQVNCHSEIDQQGGSIKIQSVIHQRHQSQDEHLRGVETLDCLPRYN
jgi:hypothetical protein